MRLPKLRSVPTRDGRSVLPRNPNVTRRIMFGRSERRITAHRSGCRVVSGLVPLRIIAEHSREVVAYACPRCGIAYGLNLASGRPGDRDAYVRGLAAKCCNNTCSTCGTSIPRYHSNCTACSDANRKRTNRRWAARAKAVGMDEAEDGWICADDIGYRDGYFSSIDELVEYCADEGVTLPSFVLPCSRVTASIDLGTVFEHLDEEYGGEDSVTDQFPDSKELEAAVDAFNAALKADGPRMYQADYRRVIIIDADRFNAEFGTDKRDGTPLTSWADRVPSVPAIDAKAWAAAARPRKPKPGPGDPCRFCDEGTYEKPRDAVCSCHIAPPCPSCTDPTLECDACGDEIEGGSA